MGMEQREDLVAVGAFPHGDQLVARGHHFGDLGVEAGLKAQVAAGDDTDRLAVIHHRHAGDTVLAGQLQHLADGGVGAHGNRVGNDAGFVFLDQAHMTGLGLGRHRLMNNADAAFLGDGDSQASLGHRVHGRRDQRDIQRDATRQPGRQIHLARQNVGIRGLEQHVVEREGLLVDSQGHRLTRCTQRVCRGPRPRRRKDRELYRQDRARSRPSRSTPARAHAPRRSVYRLHRQRAE